MNLRNFISKIVKVCQWLPVIWKDEDWDYAYLLSIIKYKLQRMKACLWNNSVIEHKELRDTIIDINKCISAIDEHENYYDIFETHYEKQPVKIAHRYLPSKDIEGCCYFATVNADTNKELTKEENHAYCEWIRHSHEFEQKTWQEIWNRLNTYAQKFWD